MPASQWRLLITRNEFPRKISAGIAMIMGIKRRIAMNLHVKQPDRVRKRHNKNRGGVKNQIAKHAAM